MAGKVWNLPIEIALKIREDVELYDDYEALLEVCSSWRLAMKQFPTRYINRKHTQLPFLMLVDTDDSLHRRFYSIAKERFIEIDLSPCFSPPHPPARRYFSSRGWLISVSKNISKSIQGRLYFDISLFNPFSNNNETIHAPLFHLIDDPEDLEWEDIHLLSYFSRIVVSTCPNNAKDGHDFVVAVTFGGHCKLAYWRLGHEDTWVVPHSKVFNNLLIDISFFRGELYATQYYGHNRRLIALGDLKDNKNSPQPRVVVANLEVVNLEVPANMYAGDFDNFYLLESIYDQSDKAHTSSLLVIHRCVLFDDDDKYHTASFTVLKLNDDNGNVEPINSLGNQAIFVGLNSAFAVCANADVDGGCKANYIYYTDDVCELQPPNQGGGSDMGIYCLPQGNTLPLYEGPSRFSVINPPIWIEFSGT